MHRDVVGWLLCPECGAGDLFLDASDDLTIETGSLGCRSCGTDYPIEGGIPFLLPPGLRDVVGQRESGASPHAFAEYRTEVTPAVARLVEKLGRSANVVLDLGSGRGPYLPYLSGDVICVDIFPQFLRDLATSIGGHVRVHPICASATRVPVRPGVVDLVLASELIEHLVPVEAERALHEWPRLATRWCVIDTPNGHEGSLLSRLRHLLYRTKTLTAVDHPDLPELDHHSTFAPDDFRAAGYECRGCIGWVSRKRFRLGPVWDLYDVVAWRVPSIAGTLIAISPGRAP